MTQIPNVRSDPKLKTVLEAGPLAPDGLPWPEGYFDRIPPKQTIEEATAMYGMRPRFYVDGRPGYTLEESLLPEFKVKMPEEPIEVLEQWKRDAEEWETEQRASSAVNK